MADGASGSGGAATALRLLQAMGALPADAGGSAGGQVALFDDFEAADAPLPLALAKGVSGPKGGRPSGARNKSTDEWVRYFLSQHKSPMTALGAIYSRPLAELYDELQALADSNPVVLTDKDGVVTRSVLRINPMDVLRLQMQAQQALLPYIHKQQPKALEIDAKPRGMVLLGDIPDAELGDDGGGSDLALPLAPTEENQGVSDMPAPQSDVDQSDSQDNPLIYRD